MIELMLGDCIEKMKQIPDGSVDLILTDPPYGTVRGIAAGKGLDHGMRGRTQWDTRLDVAPMLSECDRALRESGVLVLFAQEPYTSELVTSAIPNLPFSYRLIWKKNHFANALLAKKSPVSYYEDICVFRKKLNRHDLNHNNPLRDYARMVFESIGLTKKKINDSLGHYGAVHFFSFSTTQFSLCTRKTYNELIELFGIDAIDGFIAHDELTKINESFLSEHRRHLNEKTPTIFNLEPCAKYRSNVLEYSKDGGGYHPTQKPVDLLRELVRTYTNEGDTVLDFTMGSGSTGVACVRERRGFIGIEMDAGYFGVAKKRIDEAHR